MCAVRSIGETDKIILQLNKSTDDRGEPAILGYLYSTSFGYVGTFTGTQTSDLKSLTKSIDNPVPGIHGTWIDSQDATRSVTNNIVGRNIGAIGSPSAQILSQAWIQQRLYMPDSGPFDSRDTINRISYDIFTGHLILRTNGMYLGGHVFKDEIQTVLANRNKRAVIRNVNTIHKFKQIPH